MYEYAARLAPSVRHPSGVIDGDTVLLDLDLGFYQWRKDQSYRLLRIDAPELPTVEGIAAKGALIAFLYGKKLIARTEKSDHFGRFLVDLTADGVNVSDWLVSSGLAILRTY